MAVFHTHAVAGSLGGILADFFAHPKLCRIFFLTENWQHYIGLAYGIHSGQVNAGFKQMRSQFLGLGLNGEQLQVGDDAIHGEKAYVMWEHRENTSTKTCLRDPLCDDTLRDEGLRCEKLFGSMKVHLRRTKQLCVTQSVVTQRLFVRRFVFSVAQNFGVEPSHFVRRS
ncbi:hypothetical protein FF1_031111 [Malus domestica]